jgi:hypothetical protein
MSIENDRRQRAAISDWRRQTCGSLIRGASGENANGEVRCKSAMAAAVLLAILLVAGCAAPKTLIQYSPPPTVIALNSPETSGLRLIVDPMFDRVRARQVFDLEPERLGLLAIHLQVENNNPNASFLLQKENFRLQASVSQTPGVSSTGQYYRPETNGSLGGRGASSPEMRVLLGVVFGVPNTVYDAAVNRSFVREEIRDQVLAPGRSASGCVYFQTGKGQTPGRALLTLSFRDLRTRQDTIIAIPIANETSDK